MLDLGSVNEEDETWINGRYVGGSSFASRTQHQIPPGVLKEGVNVIATNIFCSWRNCGIRGPAENRAVRFADGTSVPLSNTWKYQEVPDTLIAPQLPWGPTHGVTMNYNGMVSPVGAVRLPGRGVVPGRIRHLLRAGLQAHAAGHDGGLAATVRESRTAVPHRAAAQLRTDPGATRRLGLGRRTRGAAPGSARGHACGDHRECGHR